MTDMLDVAAWQESMAVRRPADRAVFVATAGAAVLTDVAVRSGPDGLAGAVLVGLVAGGLLLSGRVANAQARAVAATAVVFGLFLAMRSSPWLLPFDILAIGGLLVLAASLASGGSLLDLTIPAAVARAVHATVHGLAAPAFLAAPMAGGRLTSRRVMGVMRGLALAVPLLVVLGVLLASADAVFAGFFNGWDALTPIEHGVLLVIGAWGMAGLLRLASAGPPAPPGQVRYRLGRTESTIVLGSLVALFAAFAVAQVVAASEGGRHVIETAGLTYAEYARTGFFQLLAVAAITLGALLGLRAAVDLSEAGDRRRFTLLAGAAVALTLVIVAVALARLNLYQDAFGLTMLRLYSTVFAVWIGVVFVLLGVDLAGVGRARRWLPSAAVAAGLVSLLALNVVNPEALVVRHNVSFAERTGRFDPDYLTDLSDDAVPALVDALPRLGPDARRTVLVRVCEMGSAGQATRPWWAFNGSRDAAVEARQSVCVPGR